jgi:hypothetical protein
MPVRRGNIDMDADGWQQCSVSDNRPVTLLRNVADPEYAYCTACSDWKSIKSTGNIRRHLNANHSQQGGRAATRPQISARFALLFINAGIAYRIVENEQLRMAVDLDRIANAKVLTQKIHLLRMEVDKRLHEKVSHLKCVNIEDDGSTDKGRRRMFAYVVHGINDETLEEEHYVLDFKEPPPGPVNHEVVGKMMVDVIDDFEMRERMSGITTDAGGDEVKGVTEDVMTEIPELSGAYVTCLLHFMNNVVGQLHEESAAKAKFALISEFRASFSLSGKFVAFAKDVRHRDREKLKEALANDRYWQAMATQLGAAAAKRESMVDALARLKAEEEERFRKARAEWKAKHGSYQEFVDIVADHESRLLCRDLSMRVMIQSAGDTRWWTWCNTVTSILELWGVLNDYYLAGQMTRKQSEIFLGPALKPWCEQLARFYKAWMLIVKHLESEKVWGKSALILPSLSAMVQAIDLLGEDFEGGKKAMKAYIENYKEEHPATIALGRQGFFFGLRLPLQTVMSVAVAAEMLEDLEAELDGDPPFPVAPSATADVPVEAPAEHDFLGQILTPARAPVVVETLSVAQQIREYQAERERPDVPENFQSIEYWEHKIGIWPQLARKAQRVLSRLVVSSATERVFSRVKWLEGLRRLRLTETHLSDLVICNTNFALTEAVALDPQICQNLFG